MSKPQLITHEGESLTRPQWSDRLGIPLATIAWRHRKGMSPEQILAKSRPQADTSDVRLTYDGKTLTLREWATFLGVPYNTIRHRYRMKLPVRDVLSKVSLRTVPHNKAPKGARNRKTARVEEWTLHAERPRTGHLTFLTVDGVRRSLAEWSAISGVSVVTIISRRKNGLTPEEIIKPLAPQKVRVTKQPARKVIFARRTMLTFEDETMTVEDWAHDLGIPFVRVLARLNAGNPIHQCLEKAA